MDTQPPAWHRQYGGALPLILTDTSALVDLAKLELQQDTTMPPSETARANIARAVVDNLVGSGSRTMVLTRRNFIELFATISGTLDLMEEDGQLKIPEGAVPELFYSDSRIIYDIFQQYQQTGKLRCYRSAEEMLGEEVGPPRGGIVIVDVNARGEYPTHGRLNNRRQVPDSVVDWNSAQTRAAQAPNAGDDRLIALGEKILNYTHENGFSHRFMVFNNDRGLRERFDAQSDKMIDGPRSTKPTHARTLSMIAGLFQGHQECIPGCDITGEELSRMAKATMQEREARRRTPPGAESIEKEAGHIANWLDATAPDALQAADWVMRTAERQERQVG